MLVGRYKGGQRGLMPSRTLVPELHLGFERFELVGLTAPHFFAHPLAGPLLHAVEPLVDVHDGGLVEGGGLW